MAPNAEMPFTTNSQIICSEVAAAPKLQTCVKRLQKKLVSWAPASFMITTKECSIIRTDDDGSSSWYKRSDFKSFKAANRSICILARAIEKEQRTQHILGHSTPKQELECCTRGLEMMMNGKERMVRRQRAICAVLEEQLDQWEQQVSSPDFIAELYNEISSPAQTEAHILGLQDQQEATAIHDAQQQQDVEEKMGKAGTTTSIVHRISNARIFQTPRTRFAPACAL